MDVPPPQGEDDFGNLQLPLLNPVRDATLAYGDWGDRSRLADMGLYQGRRIGPYVVDWPPESPDNQYHLNK